MQEKHPLEGEHIIYQYSTQDYAGEGEALALYRLARGCMQELYHPVDHVMQASDIGEQNIDELIELITRRRIKKVYSVWHSNPFFTETFKYYNTLHV